VAVVTRRFRLDAEVPDGPVLLVDDQVVTGWTLTVAARALREAGATEVLPLVLATR
jgi:ATP-dependent DNA helicase RecQ